MCGFIYQRKKKFKFRLSKLIHLFFVTSWKLPIFSLNKTHKYKEVMKITQEKRKPNFLINEIWWAGTNNNATEPNNGKKNSKFNKLFELIISYVL